MLSAKCVDVIAQTSSIETRERNMSWKLSHICWPKEGSTCHRFGSVLKQFQRDKVIQSVSAPVYRILENLAVTQCGRTLEHMAGTDSPFSSVGRGPQLFHGMR